MNISEFMQAHGGTSSAASSSTSQPMTVQQFMAAHQQPAVTNQPPQSPLTPYVKGAENVAIGAGKQVARTALNIGSLLERGVSSAINAIPGVSVHAKGNIQAPTGAGAKAIAESPGMQPKGAAQQVGDIGANLAEWFLPAGDIAKGEEAVNIASKALPKVAGTIARIGGKAAIEAGQGAATTYAQTGSGSQAGVSAALFGTLKGVTGAMGEAAKAVGLPEHLYSRIFSRTASDFKNMWQGMSSEAMRASNPEEFKALTDAGIIHDANGKIAVDDSTAKWALQNNIKGSPDKMGSLLTTMIRKSEYAAQTLVKNFKGAVKISYPDNLVSVLRKVASDFQDVADNKYTNLANDLANKIYASTRDAAGKITSNTASLSGEDALTLRRFLDSLRSESSFNTDIMRTRALGQKNFKFLSDKVRASLTDAIPALKPVMRDYSYQIRALGDLASKMKGETKKAVLDMWDTMIFDIGLSGGQPGVGAALGVARRGLDYPGISTPTAQLLEHGTQTKVGALGRGTVANVFGLTGESNVNQAP